MSEMFDDFPLRAEEGAEVEAIPFERVPYALWSYEDDGTLPTRAEEATFVLHKDLETEYLHVMLFETLDDAYKTLAEFKAATGRNAEPKRTDVRAIGEHFHIRLFPSRRYLERYVTANLPARDGLEIIDGASCTIKRLTPYKQVTYPFSAPDNPVGEAGKRSGEPPRTKMSINNRPYLPIVLVRALLFFVLIALFLLPKQVKAQDHLLFCNNPEKMRMTGVYADALLKAGETYTVFYHYKNVTGSAGNFVVALNGAETKPLRFEARQGFADPQRDPPLAGRQAMARFLSGVDKSFVGKQGSGRFTYHIENRHVVSGVLSVRCDQATRLRIYFRHAKWTVPGANVIAVDAPRREVEVALSATSGRKSFRIGEPESGMNRHLDGTYGMLYSFKIAAPAGRRVRVSFSPRGGKGGLVGSVNGDLWQSSIVPAAQWKIFFEKNIGKRGLNLTTSPFGGVFYPVELVFQLI